jgi:ketosteroid isomerase-like protein
VTSPTTTSESRKQEQLDFLGKYWNCLMAGDMENFAPLVAENCVVHYPGNHFLSGDHVGRAAIVQLYTNLYKLGIEQGTFIGEFHDATTSDDHACALIKYRIVVGKGMEIPGEAIGVFHIENGQMVEYWLLERDQKMINDIVRMSGKASLAGGSKAQMALGALKQPLALVRTLRRVQRVKRGNTQKML